MKKVLSVNFLPPIVLPTTRDFMHNVYGFRNGGNTTVVFNSGQWSLLPGESLFLGSQTDDNEVNLVGVNISFEPTPGVTGSPVNRLQVLVIKNNC